MKRFRQLIYVFVAVAAMLISAKLGHDKGTLTGYINGKRDGLNTVDDITEYESLTVESIRGIDSIQNVVKR